MIQVSTLTAQKLKRFGYPQKQSQKFYKKRKNSSVYDLLDNERDYRNEPICYDAPTAEELTKYASDNHILGEIGFFEECEAIANCIINYLKKQSNEKPAGN